MTHLLIWKANSRVWATVVTTAIDFISKKDLLLTEKALCDFCSDAFSKRADEIEALYLSAVDHVERRLQKIKRARLELNS